MKQNNQQSSNDWRGFPTILLEKCLKVRQRSLDRYEQVDPEIIRENDEFMGYVKQMTQETIEIALELTRRG